MVIRGGEEERREKDSGRGDREGGKIDNTNTKRSREK